MNKTKQKFISEIETFCTEFDISTSGFGRTVLNNSRFMCDLKREDFNPRLDTVVKVRKWIKAKRAKANKEGTL